LWVYQYLGLKKHFFTTIIDKASNTFTQNSGSEQKPKPKSAAPFCTIPAPCLLKTQYHKSFFLHKLEREKAGKARATMLTAPSLALARLAS